MIANQKFIFRRKISKASKRFAWGRQTAFDDILDGHWSRSDWDEFMNEAMRFLPRPWIKEGLNYVLGIGEA